MLTSVWALTTSARRRGARPYTGAARPARTPTEKARELMEAITVVAITVNARARVNEERKKAVAIN
jgi:hypothetical protein